MEVADEGEKEIQSQEGGPRKKRRGAERRKQPRELGRGVLDLTSVYLDQNGQEYQHQKQRDRGP